MTSETRNTVSVRGGKIHESIDIHGSAVAWPRCRTGAQDSTGTRYQVTGEPVTCRNCLVYAARRAEAARLAAASPLAAAALQLAETVEAANAERAAAPPQPTRTGPTYKAGDRISTPHGPATVISHTHGTVAYRPDSTPGEYFVAEDSPDLRPAIAARAEEAEQEAAPEPTIPMSVAYTNRRPGEECAHIEISAADLAALTAGQPEAMTRLMDVIQQAAARFN
ncbi:hypothetical protein ACGFX7_06245 [Streptomyces harbinensis]|uniref:hypothetical protein n=1 Tax=Streptomyces harbinensis TaxID=1176198 RepID=UPI00371AC571